MNEESEAFNENKLIQQWVDKKIEYPYTPLDLGNRKYKQTIAKTGFTEDILKELTDRGFSRAQIDKHIKQVRQRFGFNVRKTGKRGKQTSPSTLPDIVFTEKETGPVPTTAGTTASTTSSATPTTSSTGEIGSTMGQDWRHRPDHWKCNHCGIRECSWKRRTVTNYLISYFNVNIGQNR